MKNLIKQYNSYIDIVIVIIALIFAMVSQDGKHILLQWSALSMLWGVALVRLRTPDLYYSIMKDKAFIGYLLFIIWAIFSSFILSESKAMSIIMLIPFTGGLLSYFIGYTSTDSKALFFYRLLLGVGLLLVIYTVYQSIVLGVKRPSGTLVNWNTHAAFLAMIVLPWILRYAVKPNISKFQIAYWCVVIMMFAFAMGLTLSRGVLLIFIVVGCCFVIFSWRKRLFFKQSVYFLLCFMLGYILSNLFGSETIFQRLSATSSAESIATFSSSRNLLWFPAWQMYLDRPFLGWGLGVFSLLYKQYKDPLSNDLGYFVHNDYLQFLLELGPIGLLIFLSFVFILLKHLYRLMLRVRCPPSVLTIEPFVLLATCMGMLAHTFVTFHLYQLTIQIVFGYYLGRASKYLYFEQNESLNAIKPQVSQKNIWIYRGFCTVIIFYITISGLSFYYMNKALNTQNKQEILDSYFKASMLFPALERYDSVSASYLVEQLKQLPINAETIQKRQQIATMALSAVDRAIDKMPLNPANYVTKAEIFQIMQGRLSDVTEQYEKALKVNPYQMKVRDAFAHYLIENKQYQKALAILWDAWGRVNVDYYRNGVVFLRHQLEINTQYGNAEDNKIIEQEMQRLMELEQVKVVGGNYVFKKPIDG